MAGQLPPGLMISAPRSGSGKTTLMLGLLGVLRRRGRDVQPFKSGPDYIDTGFHTAAIEAARRSTNLDTWAMGAAEISHHVATAAGADLILAEGSMGLFDGVARTGASGTGASADLAAMMDWPVVLVLDVSGHAQSAAAVALGFATMRANVKLAGVVLNRVASARHEALVRAGMKDVGITVLGALPRQKEIAVPERHLGLVQAEEQSTLPSILAEMADFIEKHLDIDALVATAGVTTPQSGQTTNGTSPPGQRIALARDAAFSFVYPHLLEAWRKAGAEIIPFSPLADETPDPDADCCWLPGGYPELHAGCIAQASKFRDALKNFAATRPVHGECGGYMALGEALIDADGQRHEMTGLLGLVTSYEKRRMHLGYRLATLTAPIPGRQPGARLRGHEFHYSTILTQPDEPLADVVDAEGTRVPETGSRRGHVTGSFFHLIAEAAA